MEFVGVVIDGESVMAEVAFESAAAAAAAAVGGLDGAGLERFLDRDERPVVRLRVADVAVCREFHQQASSHTGLPVEDGAGGQS